MKTYYCYVAGKSGGHIIPALTHAACVVKNDPNAKILFFSTASHLDTSLLANNPLLDVYQPLSLPNVPSKKNLLAWPRFMGNLLKACWQSFVLLRRYRPVKVVSMGGYISLPVCYMAWLLRIPIHVYELNVVPGKAVVALSKRADVIHTCFKQTKKYLPAQALCQESAYPLRYTYHDIIDRAQACSLLGVDPSKKIICVLGGSQGSHFVNTLFQKLVLQDWYDQQAYVIVHQTGSADVAAVTDFYKNHDVQSLVFAYRNDINLCYCAADVIVARAGAGTLFETLFFKKPAVIIPLETVTTDHQKDNAFTMQLNHPEFFKVLLQGDIEKEPSLFFDQMRGFCQK